MTQQSIRAAAYKEWKASLTAVSFETWLEKVKSLGFYWSA